MSDWKLRKMKRITIEGFQIHRFLSTAMKQGIAFYHLTFLDELKVRMEINSRDLASLKHIAGNRYRVTELSEFGLEKELIQLLKNTATWIGLVLFFAILYYQSCFISTIRIEGYERIPESQIRETLAEFGFYRGAVKSYDFADLKTSMYQKMNITWIGITYQGTLANVKIMEGTELPKPEDGSLPCDLVAKKEGYIEKIIVREGKSAVQEMQYVRAGDVLIQGAIPIDDKSYTRNESELTRYVHADGSVKARILYRKKYYQERVSRYLKETGEKYYGISVTFGDQVLDTTKGYRPYEVSRREEREILEWNRPFPFSLKWQMVSEVSLIEAERSQEEIEKAALRQYRDAAKKYLPENAQIINKSLSFSDKENIIEINVLLHSLEEIGRKRTIVFPEEKKEN